MRAQSFVAIFCAIICAALGYANLNARVASSRAAEPSEAPRYAPCPRAKWRLASNAELQRSMLALSHILVRHRELEANRAPLSFLDWRTELPAAARSRDEALDVARTIRARILEGKESFAAAAASASEDPLTRAREGRLGMYSASDLILLSPALDCLAGLSPGNVSEVVETEFGFHVFLLREAPPDDRVALHRIVIGHSAAPFLQYSVRAGREALVQQRSREEALTLAKSISGQVTAGNFAELARTFSDHRDFETGGEFGQWSSLGPTPIPRLIEDLQRLPVGAIFGPVDTELGVQLFLRDKTSVRQEYAARTRRIAYELEAGPGVFTRERAASEAVAVLRDLGKDPDAAWSLEQWTAGAGPYRLEQELARVAVGSPFAAPVDSDSTFIIGWRVEPQRLPQERYRQGLPNDSLGPVDTFAARVNADSLQALLTEATQRLPQPLAATLAPMSAELIGDWAKLTTKDSKLLRWHEFERNYRSVLSSDDRTALGQEISSAFQRSILGAKP